MRGSPPSAGLLLPFGSLMGVIPTDSVQWGRAVRAGSDQRPSEIQWKPHSLIDPRPASAATRPLRRTTQHGTAGGRRIQWK